MTGAEGQQDGMIAGLDVPAGVPHRRALSMVFGRLLAIEPNALYQVLAAIRGRESVNVQVFNAIGDRVAIEAAARPTRRQLRSVARVPGFDEASGILTVAIHDKLVQRRATMNAESGLSCYDDIDAQLDMAHDPAVKGVWLWTDSPGGQAAGMVQQGERVRALAKVKPVVAWVDELAASAGYGLIAGATSIWGPTTLEAGSIGVRWMHVSMQGAIEAEGLKVTEFTSGRKKTWGSSAVDLSPEAQEYIQGQIDTMAKEFFSLVARGREGLTLKAVRDLEGAVLLGQDALEAKLVDHIGTREDALAHLFDLMREREKSSSVSSAGIPRADTSPRPGASKEPNMHKSLLAALVLLPGCAAMSAEEFGTDAGAEKAANAINALRADASKAPGLEAQVRVLTSQVATFDAAKADADKVVAEAVGLRAQVKLLSDKLTAEAEKTQWAEALLGVKAENRGDVEAEARRTRKDGETPQAAVDGLRAHSVWKYAFAAQGPKLTDKERQALEAAGHTETGKIASETSGIRLGR